MTPKETDLLTKIVSGTVTETDFRTFLPDLEMYLKNYTLSINDNFKKLHDFLLRPDIEKIMEEFDMCVLDEDHRGVSKDTGKVYTIPSLQVFHGNNYLYALVERDGDFQMVSP